MGELVTGDGETVLSFTVDAIEPVVCTERPEEPSENGYMFAISMTFETKAGLDMDVPTNPAAFGFISEEGTTFNGDVGTIAGFYCLPDQDTLPTEIGPGEKVTGKLVLDLPAEGGTIIYNPTYGQTESYEYSF
ncbi:hypothetical protein DDA93_15950 [Arthrobacter sp. Bz4]|nr:hypothetical protein DDA93_15950 [Arthrobacter sp. Bz4]